MAERLPQPRLEDFRFSCEIRVRFRDLDAMGHVNNAVYFTYFEIARDAYMRSLGHRPVDEESLPKLFPFILADASCRYLAPVKLGELLKVHLRVSKIGHKSFVFEYLITADQDQRHVATGQSTQVYYDYQEQRTCAVPGDFRDRIERIEGRSSAIRG